VERDDEDDEERKVATPRHALVLQRGRIGDRSEHAKAAEQRAFSAGHDGSTRAVVPDFVSVPAVSSSASAASAAKDSLSAAYSAGSSGGAAGSVGVASPASSASAVSWRLIPFHPSSVREKAGSSSWVDAGMRGRPLQIDWRPEDTA
jgi:hypothetical protein